MPRAPLDTMKFRTDFAGTLKATYGSPQLIQRRDKTGKLKPHQGWDLEAKEGTPTFAIEHGIITDVGFHHQFGKFVTMIFSRSGKTYYAFYAHLRNSCATIGSVVKPGALIGP